MSKSVTAFDQSVRLGKSGVTVTRLGLGLAPIGDQLPPSAESAALATIDRAWGLGVRYFDTAPLYGLGRSEHWAGLALRTRPRAHFTLSTKVGRLITPGRRRRQPEWMFDFSYDGVLRCHAESLERLGLERIDLLLVHDPDRHYDEAVAGAFKALCRLRDEGVVGAIGAGMNQTRMPCRFADTVPVDCLLVAGRYTLLDQSALPELLPRCAERGISVIAAGAFNSGVLADPRPGALYDYAPASDRILHRADRLAQVCRAAGVPLSAAALRFPLNHPAVASVLVGAQSPEEVESNVAAFNSAVPQDLWRELSTEGLIPPLP